MFIWRRASPLGRASPLCRDLAIDYPRSRLGGLEIFYINAPKRTGPPRGLASQSSVHTTKFVLASIFSDNFSFYKFCLFMCRLCRQISDSGFRGKIDLVSPGDSAKRDSPGRRTAFSHVNAR